MDETTRESMMSCYAHVRRHLPETHAWGRAAIAPSTVEAESDLQADCHAAPEIGSGVSRRYAGNMHDLGTKRVG